MLYEAFVYGIHFVGQTHREVEILVEDYVLDELSGKVEEYEIVRLD